jgi:surface antigen Omp85-like protein
MTLGRLAALALVCGGAARADEAPGATRLEPGVLPAVAYDSDTGLGAGAIVTLARFAPGYTPYRWRVQAQIYAAIKRAPGGGLELPYHDDYLLLDLPGDPVRWSLRLAFGRFRTTGYYGLGMGAAIDAARLAAVPRAYQYDRAYPEIEASARVALARDGGKLDLVLGARLARNVVHPYAGSKLEEDAAAGLVRGAEPHTLAVASAGLLLDLRDHESAPARGSMHELTLRAGAGLGAGFAYAGARATSRLFAPLWADRLVVAARAMLDALAGDPPVYELALGGATTVRGVRGQRYHGQVKLVGNLELRARVARFAIGSQRFILGGLVFADAGRAIAAGGAPGGPLAAVGVGGGLRVQWGEHFIIRADLGVSPTDGTSGLYIDASHIF